MLYGGWLWPACAANGTARTVAVAIDARNLAGTAGRGISRLEQALTWMPYGLPGLASSSPVLWLAALTPSFSWRSLPSPRAPDDRLLAPSVRSRISRLLRGLHAPRARRARLARAVRATRTAR